MSTRLARCSASRKWATSSQPSRTTSRSGQPGCLPVFFLKPDAATLPALGQIASWVNGQPNYSAAAKSTFLQIADYYLVAQAMAGNHVVVTHERPNNSVHVVKIPNVCLGVGVKCATPFEMLRRERARFILGK